MPADVFISYHTDSAGEAVDKIAIALESAGIKCWNKKLQDISSDTQQSLYKIGTLPE